VKIEKRIKNNTKEKTKEGMMSFNPSFAINDSLKLFSLSGPSWAQDFL
jgi:hypothetical protein